VAVPLSSASMCAVLFSNVEDIFGNVFITNHLMDGNGVRIVKGCHLPAGHFTPPFKVVPNDITTKWGKDDVDVPFTTDTTYIEFLDQFIATLELSVAATSLKITTNTQKNFDQKELIYHNLSMLPCSSLVVTVNTPDTHTINITVGNTQRSVELPLDIFTKTVADVIVLVTKSLDLPAEGWRFKVDGKIQVKTRIFGEVYKLDNSRSVSLEK